MKYCLILFIWLPLAAASQKAFTPEYSEKKVKNLVTKFKPEYVLWQKNAEPTKPVKDTIANDTLKVWEIRSADFNMPIYAFYADTSAATGNWKAEKNYIMSTEKLGPGKAIFLYYDDGVPLKKNDIATLRRYKEVPLLEN